MWVLACRPTLASLPFSAATVERVKPLAPLLAAVCALMISVGVPVATWAASGISVSPSQVSFREQCVAAASDSVPVTVRNSGTDPLQVRSVAVVGANAADFSITGGEARTLAPGASFVISVIFTAQTQGNRSAILRIESSAPSSPTQISLSGTGVTRTLEISPDRLVFGDQRTGTPSDDMSLVLKSTGSARVKLKAFNVSGDASKDFRVRGSATRSISPGNEDAVPIAFEPRTLGRRTATLTIDSDACAGKTSVALAGVGTAPKIKVSPSAVEFGSIPKGSTSTAVPMVVSNVGRAPLRITEIKVEGAQSADFRFEAFPELPKVLGAGQEFPINATFVPSADGPRRALLRFSSDDPAMPSLAVSLTGNMSGAGSVEPSPAASSLESLSATPPSDRGKSKIAARHRYSGGSGDWLAIGLVCAMVAGVFITLSLIRRRRSFAR